jgi:hypothetical protein
MANTRKFRHQEVSVPGPGTKVRTVRAGAHEIKIAFPKGARKRGSGKIVSILHPATEKNPSCDGLTVTEVQSIEIPVALADSPDLGAAIQEILEAPTEALTANPLDLTAKWDALRSKLAGWIAPARNPKGKTFKDLPIGTKFEFDRSGPFSSSLASGPWVKTSERTYIKESGGEHRYTVGSTRAAIGEVYGKNPGEIPAGEHRGVPMVFSGISYKAPSLGLFGYRDDLQLKRAIDKKLKKAKTKTANPGQWGMTAGGTGAAEGKHGYTLYSDAGEYHIWPFTTSAGRHAGYSLKFANTKGKTSGGLWHELGTFRSPGKAKGAARRHEKSLLKSSANPKRKGCGYGRDKNRRNLDEIDAAANLVERFRGFPAERITEAGEPNRMRDDYAGLGWCEQFVFVPPGFDETLDCEEISDLYNEEYQQTGDSKKSWAAVADEFGIPLRVYDVAGDEIRLASSADGKQLYLLGGKQSEFKSVLSEFDTDTSKDKVSLGLLLCLTYAAQKVQAGDTEERGYYHVFGEEGGVPPGAYYDNLNDRIMLYGGTYHLNDAEAGIRN